MWRVPAQIVILQPWRHFTPLPKWLSAGNLEKSSAMYRVAEDLAGDSLNMRFYLAVWETGLAIMNGRFDEVETRAVNALSLGSPH